ncbi:MULTISPECIES: class I SAM-dependent methyltransferase [unclassified Streptomyces]|uniref:class I SAM-dependent methyltransferase n=1 Tax=unclassified Streptomyces TaxID=2593676 RepID=UPI00382B236D
MKDLGNRSTYWDGAGAAKTFTHPVHHGWLAEVSAHARIFDQGCGYGRVMAELSDHGYSDVSGVDPSVALIERGRTLRPGLRLSVLESPPHLACAPAAFDAVLLFAVLTCIPDNEDQQALVTELNRDLAPGGLLDVSDLLLQHDERNRDRHAAHDALHPPPRTGSSPRRTAQFCRHHDITHLHALLSGFDLLKERTVEVATMNAHRSQAVQLLTRKR